MTNDFCYFEDGAIYSKVDRRMIISLVNRKGGVGKTSISFNLAKDLRIDLIANDSSILTRIYNEVRL